MKSATSRWCGCLDCGFFHPRLDYTKMFSKSHVDSLGIQFREMWCFDHPGYIFQNKTQRFWDSLIVASIIVFNKQMQGASACASAKSCSLVVVSGTPGVFRCLLVRSICLSGSARSSTFAALLFCIFKQYTGNIS